MHGVFLVITMTVLSILYFLQAIILTCIVVFSGCLKEYI